MCAIILMWHRRVSFSMRNILVIDDDERLLSLIVEILKKNSFQVTGATSANEGRKKIRDEHFDAIVADWMMPKESGIDFITTLRNSTEYQEKIPAIMLTALDDIDHKVQGFEAGYDDYLVKPFEARELIARLNALIKRTSQNNCNTTVKFGNCVFDTKTEILLHNGSIVQLSSTELTLLKILAHRPNTPFSRTELAKRLSSCVSERTIDVQITRLRKKIGDDPKYLTSIKTIRHIGYILCCNEE